MLGGQARSAGKLSASQRAPLSARHGCGWAGHTDCWHRHASPRKRIAHPHRHAGSSGVVAPRTLAASSYGRDRSGAHTIHALCQPRYQYTSTHLPPGPSRVRPRLRFPRRNGPGSRQARPRPSPSHYRWRKVPSFLCKLGSSKLAAEDRVAQGTRRAVHHHLSACTPIARSTDGRLLPLPSSISMAFPPSCSSAA